MYDGVRRERQGMTVQPAARAFHDCPLQKPPPLLREGMGR
jgi:hypothetical protein